MDPVVAILIWTVIVVLIAPVIVACVFLGDRPLFPQIDLKPTPSDNRPNCRLSADERKIRELENRYGSLQRELISVRKRLALSLKAENDLRKRIATIQNDEQISPVKVQEFAAADKQPRFRKKRVELGQLQELLRKQEEENRAHRLRLSVMEDETQAAYTTKQVKIAELKYAAAERAVNKTLSKSDVGGHADLIARMEKKILLREEEATRFFELAVAGNLKPKLPTVGMKLLLKLNGCSSFAATTIMNVNARIADFAVSVDASVSRAFDRLQLHFKQARQIADVSMSGELELEKCVVAETNQWIAMRDASEVEGVTDGRKAYASARASSLDESVRNLTAGLELIKTKNLSTQQTLFYVDAIVRRLSILALLIPAIPLAKKSMQSQFIDLTNLVCLYLQTCTESPSAVAASVPNDLVLRLNTLEQNTLMMYIKIAKGESDKLSSKSLARLKNDVATIATALELERSDAAAELEKWSGIGTLAEQDNQVLLLAVAQNRKARCSEIIKLTDQTLDVLNVTVSMTEQRAASKTKAS